MRISDWSSDVCSSDLPGTPRTGDVISSLPENTDECVVFHAGTRLDGAELKTSGGRVLRSEEHTSELQSLMRISYAVFCLKKKKQSKPRHNYTLIRTNQLNTSHIYSTPYKRQLK